jgi:hypothetical protein
MKYFGYRSFDVADLFELELPGRRIAIVGRDSDETNRLAVTRQGWMPRPIEKSHRYWSVLVPTSLAQGGPVESQRTVASARHPGNFVRLT